METSLKILQGIVERLEDFLIRSFLPISIFLFQFLVLDLIGFDGQHLREMVETLAYVYTRTEGMNGVIGWGIFFLLLGFGFFSQVFQRLPDEFNKKDYEECCPRCLKKVCSWVQQTISRITCENGDESKIFMALRKEVKSKIKKDDRVKFWNLVDQFHDYELYLALSQILPNDEKRYRFVDEVRIIYMIFFSLFLNAIIFYYLIKGMSLSFFLVVALVGMTFFVMACCMARKRYKSRNQRLYLKYLSI
ncbi:hypothetical protein [Hydrogenimonas sp.]